MKNIINFRVAITEDPNYQPPDGGLILRSYPTPYRYEIHVEDRPVASGERTTIEDVREAALIAITSIVNSAHI